MNKLLRHTWQPTGTIEKGKLNHKQCETCKCVKYYSTDYDQTVYETRIGHRLFGRILFRAPACDLPYTKL